MRPLRRSISESARIVHAAAKAGARRRIELARMAAEETGMGVMEDKVIKNLFATEYVYHNIRNVKTVGLVNDCPQTGLTEYAEPLGVVLGVIPVTNLTLSTPASVTADTGMDVLAHALESYVSVMASDYTDPLALRAIQLVFQYLPLAYKDGANALAREKVHNASTIAGMAFTNAMLGVNHCLAHILGATFGIPHGRANALLCGASAFASRPYARAFSLIPP